MSWRPSDELFDVRVRALIDRDGLQGVADFYGVSTRTVRRWRSGESSPRSDRTAVSIARRGRSETGAVIQERGRGRFSTRRTIYDPSVTRAARTIRERREEQRATDISVARNQRMREMAEARPTDVTYAEMADLERNLDRLTEARQAAEELGFEYQSDEWYEWWRDNYGYEYDYDDFRQGYDSM